MVDPARMARAEPEMLVPKLSSLSRQPNVQISRSSPDGKVLFQLDTRSDCQSY